MSIYASCWDLMIRPEGFDRWHEVHGQIVGSWVRFECDYLPPPLPEDADEDEWRAVVFTLDGEPKGGPGYDGQQYHRPLLVMSGEEYKRTPFGQLLDTLESCLIEREADHEHCLTCGHRIMDGRAYVRTE